MRAKIPEQPITNTGRDRLYRFEQELLPGQVVASVFFYHGVLQEWSLKGAGPQLTSLAQLSATAVDAMARLDYFPTNENSACHLTVTKELPWDKEVDDKLIAEAIGSVIGEEVEIEYTLR